MMFSHRILTQRLSLLLLILCVPLLGKSQPRTYSRKSVTHIGTVVLSPNRPNESVFNSTLKKILTFPRFDYTELSDSAKAQIQRTLQLSAVPKEAIQDSLIHLILPEITNILNTVAEVRAKENLSEEALSRSAVEKLKGSGLTAEDIQLILNSAYLYLPVITHYIPADNKEGKRESTIPFIYGYILWFRLNQSRRTITLLDSDTSITGVTYNEAIESISKKRRSVSSPIDLSGKLDWVMYYHWAIKNAEKIYTHPDFQLFSEISRVEGDDFYSLLGQKEGVKLDDVYTIFEQIEDENGKTTQKKVGYARVDSVADNRTRRAYSKFTTYLGDVEPGQLLLEQYSKPFGLFIRPKYATLQFPQSASLTLLENPLTASSGVDLGLWYNGLRALNFSHLYVLGEFGLSYVLNSIPQSGGGIFASGISFYGGLLKKMWLGNINVNLGLYGGIEAINLVTNEKIRYDDKLIKSITSTTVSVRGDVGVELMITPDIMVGAVVQYRIGPNASTTLHYGDEETIEIKNDPRFDNIHFRGLSGGVYLSLPIQLVPDEEKIRKYPSLEDILYSRSTSP